MTREDGRLASIEAKIDGLTETVIEIKTGIGKKVEEHSETIAVMDEKVSTLTKVAWLVFTPIIGAIVVAILGLIIKKQ